MANATEDDFRLNPRQIANICKYLGTTPESEHCPRLVEDVERAVLRYLADRSAKPRSQAATDPFYETPTGQSVLRQKAAVDVINQGAEKLLIGLQQYVAERGPFSDGRDAFVHGLIDEIAWHDAEVRSAQADYLTLGEPPRLDREHLLHVLNEVASAVERLKHASDQILERWTGERGRQPSVHNQLVVDLYAVVADHLASSHPRHATWMHQPAAPKGPLCQLFGLVLEATGEDSLTNPAARIRNALEWHQQWLDEIDRTADVMNPWPFEADVNPES